MKKRNIGSYLEQQILSATPMQLIVLSYQSATQAVRDARQHLAQKNIPERVRSISLAHGILAELYGSLDFKAADGRLALELGRLYDYMMRRLLEANARSTDEPLAETLELLSSLAGAWEQVSNDEIRSNPPRTEASASPWQHLSASPTQSRYSLSF